jgi:hypothetical protein
MLQLFSILIAVLLPGTTLPAIDAARSGPELTCPVEDWRAKCRRVSSGEARSIMRAVLTHVTVRTEMCARTREAVLTWLWSRTEVWVFTTHAADNAVNGTYIGGQTMHFASERPAGIGFREAVLAWSAPELARVAAHEGAHVAGYDEAAARNVETACIAPTP